MVDVLTAKCPTCQTTLVASGSVGDDKAFCPNATCRETVFHLRDFMALPEDDRGA